MTDARTKHLLKIRKHKYSVGGFNVPQLEFTTEDIENNGVIVKRLVIKEVHPADNFKGLKAEDFKLENIIAAGLENDLKFNTLSINTFELNEIINKYGVKIVDTYKNMLELKNNEENEEQPKEEKPKEE